MSSITTEAESEEPKTRPWPIVYCSRYNVKFCGLEKFHPFDASKWANIIRHLKVNSMITDQTIYTPEEISENDLLKVHTKQYINSLKWSFRVAGIAEMPIIALVPNILVQKWYLKAMRYQVGGSLLAGKLAMERGWAINVGGGFHHCSRNRGGGFCPYADITLLIQELFANYPIVKSLMIVDLDAHQGNGHEMDFLKDDKVFILDVYNAEIYPQDTVAKEGINCRVELKHFTTDQDYLYLVERSLEKSLSKFHPDVIVYNAGTDILAGDPLGRLSVSAEVCLISALEGLFFGLLSGIISRDKIVFMKARERRVPIVMLTSGGYLKRTAKIIADSILNLASLGLIDNI